ncbi:MAG TPA: protein-disulfide reductase DsbD domain-containing protein, partial [Gemmatimonadaceae bacterium]|nr:protein-disulfide reductase DsbD domain-containing protein [Gemmatimonadaceae bacterium]
MFVARHVMPLQAVVRRSVLGAASMLAAVLSVATSVVAQRPARDPSPHSDAALVSESANVQPGGTVTVAVRLTLDPGWHTYWLNPGDAGLPLRVTWTLPAGVTVGPLRFPVPRLTPQAPLMSYGYEDELFVLADVQVPAGMAPGPLALTGRADWLACAEVCLPASGPLALTVPVTASGPGGPTGSTAAIAETRAMLPAAATGWTMRSWTTPTGYVVTAIRDSGAALAAPYFFVDSAEVLEHADAQRVATAGDTLVLAIPRAKVATGSVTALRGILAADVQAASPRGWLLDVPVTAPSRALRTRAEALLSSAGARPIGGVTAVSAADASSAATELPDPSADMTLIAAVLFAFVGGLLLNLMPCVFPVLTVKVLALLQHGGGDASRGRKHGAAFGLGVLLSFWVLAGVLMALRAGGEQLGWGFQLQSPPVVAMLALLLFVLALNLGGLFEIGLSLTRLGSAGAGGGYGDSLLTGALAVLVAAPCTAPFMGAALGFALVQPAFVGMLVFTALAIGLALPFVLLASMPRLLRFLPRPGPWLETLKQLFAFPLYATVVWLLWVFGLQAGVDALAIVLLAMIVVAFGGWLWSRGVRHDRGATRAAAAIAMACAVVVTLLGATRPAPAASAAVAVAGWEAWSPERVRQLRAEGRPVFIDFTAAWCLS